MFAIFRSIFSNLAIVGPIKFYSPAKNFVLKIKKKKKNRKTRRNFQIIFLVDNLAHFYLRKSNMRCFFLKKENNFSALVDDMLPKIKASTNL